MSGVTAAAKPFKGAVAKLTANETIPNSTTTTPNWDDVVYDTSAFWAGGNPSRLTIPAGVSKVRLTFRIDWNTAPNSTAEIWYIHKNSGGGDITKYNMNAQTYAAIKKGNAPSQIIEVSEGDYFEMQVFQSSGGSNLLTTLTTFGIEVIE